MVRKVFALLGREVNGLHEAAYALAAFTLVSQLVALARDRLIAGVIGPSAALDTFYAAFRLPDLVFVLTTSLVSSAVLMPQVVARLENRPDLRRFLDGAASFFALISVAVAGLAFAFAPQLTAWLAPGFAGDAARAADLVEYTRVLLLSPILLGFSQIWGSVAQAYRKVALYALSPVLYNLGFVVGVAALYPRFGIEGLIVGVLAGAALHAAVTFPAARRAGGGFRLASIPWREAKSLVLESLPRSAALAMGQLATLVLVAMASRMPEGSISVFQLASNLQSVPLALIGTSYSMAAFPILAALAAENRREEFGRKLAEAARQIVFWSLPVVALFVVLRAQIVRVVLGAGDFGWGETRLVAAVLAALVLACVAQGLILLFARASYAAGNTWRPFAANLAGAAVTAGCGLALPGYLAENPAVLAKLAAAFRLSGVVGAEVVSLGLASTAGAFVAAGLLLALVARQTSLRGGGLTRASVQGLISSLWAGVAAYIVLGLTDGIFSDAYAVTVFAHGLLAGVIGLGAWVFALRVMGNPELGVALEQVRRRVWKTPVVAPDTTPDQVPEA